MANTREQIKKMICSLYKSIIKVDIDSENLNSVINSLVSRQTTLYNFLFSVICIKIGSINITYLIDNLYLGVLNRKPTLNENSKLLSVFNNELRKYGSKERALSKLLTVFVKNSAVVRYCKSIGIDNI